MTYTNKQYINMQPTMKDKLQFTSKKSQMLSSHSRIQESSETIQENMSVATNSSKISPVLRQAMKKYRDKAIKDSGPAPRLPVINQQIRACSICFNLVAQGEGNFCNCRHRQLFCSSCLHHYSIYKINSFQNLTCPEEDCKEQIDTNSDLFKKLPKDVQQKYHKIHLFYSTLNDPNTKLCPLDNCEGIIKMQIGGLFICGRCKNQFCGKCLMKNHDGSCDQQEIDFFQQNLHYRQCKKCKMLIQKTGGCDHMLCRCGFSFCYVCQQPWSQIHGNGIHVTSEGKCIGSCKCLITVFLILVVLTFLGVMSYNLISGIINGN